VWPLAGPGTRAKRADETGSELKGQRASADLNYSARQCWPIGGWQAFVIPGSDNILVARTFL